jgi:hypothetical protein
LGNTHSRVSFVIKKHSGVGQLSASQHLGLNFDQGLNVAASAVAIKILTEANPSLGKTIPTGMKIRELLFKTPDMFAATLPVRAVTAAPENKVRTGTALQGSLIHSRRLYTLLYTHLNKTSADSPFSQH